MRSQPAASGESHSECRGDEHPNGSDGGRTQSNGDPLIGRRPVRCSTAGHRVNDQGIGKRVIVKCMCNDCWRDRPWMGDTKSSVVPERPDIIGCWAKIGAEAIAAAKVFVGCVDRLNPSVKLRGAALSTDVARLG